MKKYDEFQNEKKAILPDTQKSKKKLGRKKEKLFQNRSRSPSKAMKFKCISQNVDEKSKFLKC